MFFHPSPALIPVSAPSAFQTFNGGAARNRLILALLIWGGVLPPVAGGMSDYMEDEMLGLMVRSAFRAALPRHPLPSVARRAIGRDGLK